MKRSGPYNVMRNPNDWENVPRDPVTIGGAILGAIGVTATATVTAVVGYVATTAVTSWAMSALAPKPDYGAFGGVAGESADASFESRGILVNARAPAASAEFVYGEVRKGGPVTFYEETGESNKYLHQIVVLAYHEIDAVVSIYINDEIVTIGQSVVYSYAVTYVTATQGGLGPRNKFAALTSTQNYSNGSTLSQEQFLALGGTLDAGETYYTGQINLKSVDSVLENVVTTPRWTNDDGPKIRIRTHLGNQTSADSALVAETSANSSVIGRGVAYLYIRYAFDQDVFANGVPLITALVRGKKVYDPRTGSTAYSNNAALCVRDFITSDYGLNDQTIDDVSFAAAANESDESISLSGGGSEKRYTINGIVKSGSSIGQVLGQQMTACAGTLFRGTGYWKLKVGAYSAPVKTLTLDDLRGPINLQTRVSMRENFNAVRGTFNNAAQDYITTDYPQTVSTAFKTEDGGEEVALDLPLPFTTSAATAQRIAKLTLFRGREQMTLDADFGLEAFGVEAGDIIAFTNERYGFDEKEFEVVGWRFSTDQDAGDLRVRLSLRETSAAAFSWNAEESQITANNTNLLSYTTVPDLGLSISDELRVYNENAANVAILSLTSSLPALIDYVQVEFKRSADATWIEAGQGNLGTFEINNIVDGLYDFRARAVNSFGLRGAWATRIAYSVEGLAPPPANVTNFSGNVVGNSLHLSWSPVPDLDLSYYKVRFSSETSGATYSNAIDLVSKVARPGDSVVVPAQTGTYFIKAVDKLGGLSASPASFVVLVDSNNVEDFNAIATLTEHPSFSGVRSSVVVLTDDEGNYLALDTAAQFDSATGDFDDALGLLDGGSGDVVPSGIYYFSNSIDLGEKYTSRIKPTFKVDYLDYVNDFDSATGDFDEREGDFDGDPDQFDTTSASIELRHTDDDPAGAPSWSDWQNFIVADISARAMEFRVVMTSRSTSATPAVRELSAEIDMPERTETQQDITITGSKVVTFPTAFKAAPALGLSLANLADGERYVISNKTRTGFTIDVLNGGTTSTNPVTLDYVARGYGKELT
jgi:hypothetical protein